MNEIDINKRENKIERILHQGGFFFYGEFSSE
jgi:hypothetical protein